jgi:uridine kinase
MRPRLVIIAGGTASGKSALAEAFVLQVGALHLRHDDYYRDVGDPTVFDYDHPDALDSALLVDNLRDLLAGRPTDGPDYDFKTHRRRLAPRRLEPQALLVLEGILVLAVPEIAAMGDLRVFVTAPEPLRLERRIARDMSVRGRTRDQVLQQFHRTVKPNHDRFVEPSRRLADLIIDGTAPLFDGVRAIQAAIAALA